MALLTQNLAPTSAEGALALSRVRLTYLWSHGRLPDLVDAPRFTEMVQRRKLYDRDPRQVARLDKVAAKRMAARLLGPEWATPTLWRGDALSAAPSFGFPAILKARHGCNQFVVLRETPRKRAWAALRGRTRQWTAGAYGKWLDEWAYRDVPRGLLAEPLLGDGRMLPLDYKIYVFRGRATHVQVHLDRAHDHRWVLHDRKFRPLHEASDRPAPPRSLGAMLDAAETLAAGFDFLRVDFYEIDGAPRFGEFCLYPGSGLDRFADDWIDFELGKLWLDAPCEVTRSKTVPRPSSGSPEIIPA
jgi:hypothetical protein